MYSSYSLRVKSRENHAMFSMLRDYFEDLQDEIIKLLHLGLIIFKFYTCIIHGFIADGIDLRKTKLFLCTVVFKKKTFVIGLFIFLTFTYQSILLFIGGLVKIHKVDGARN